VRAFPQGTIDEAGEGLQAALRAGQKVYKLRESLTSLGRNEFICWVDDGRQAKTGRRRIERACENLPEGKKRHAAGRDASTAPTRLLVLGSKQS
jgi:hypothetical protein